MTTCYPSRDCVSEEGIGGPRDDNDNDDTYSITVPANSRARPKTVGKFQWRKTPFW